MRSGPGAGIAVAVPLTLLQWSVHQHAGGLDPALVLHNVCACSAVYGADRIPPEESRWSYKRVPSQLGAVYSTAYLASAPETALLAPWIPALHVGYATWWKPRIAPVKPFFVAALWTAAVCYVPAAVHSAAAGVSPVPAADVASLFLSLTALSHAVDVLDAEEDEANGLITPAVAFRQAASSGRAYAVALALAAAAVHEHVTLYDAIILAALPSVLYQGEEDKRWIQTASGTAISALLLAWCHVHAFEVMGSLLESTQSSHEWAVSGSVKLAAWALSLPPPWNKAVIDGMFFLVDAGDSVGSLLLALFEASVRARM